MLYTAVKKKERINKNYYDNKRKKQIHEAINIICLA